MILIFSYRESYTSYDRCNYITSTRSSDFNVHASKDEEEAAEWIAQQIKSDEGADFIHIIADDWKQLEALAEHGYLNTSATCEKSIMLPRVFDDKFEDYDDYLKEEQRLGELHAKIESLVKEKLK